MFFQSGDQMTFLAQAGSDMGKWIQVYGHVGQGLNTSSATFQMIAFPLSASSLIYEMGVVLLKRLNEDEPKLPAINHPLNKQVFVFSAACSTVDCTIPLKSYWLKQFQNNQSTKLQFQGQVSDKLTSGINESYNAIQRMRNPFTKLFFFLNFLVLVALKTWEL